MKSFKHQHLFYLYLRKSSDKHNIVISTYKCHMKECSKDKDPSHSDYNIFSIFYKITQA